MNSNENLTLSYKGRTIDDRYQLLDIVGSGAMSVVYKAKDLTMNRTVALKLLNEELTNNEKAIRRFANESKAVAMISYKNIVKIYDVNLDHEPKYIVMEYVSGRTLKQYMDENTPLSPEVAVSLMQQLLNALRHAHDKGIIHLDVKPENVMITDDLQLKLTDFGIAKFQGSEETEEEEKAIGTVSYISPEQANAHSVDYNTDIYSAGVILYEMLAGRLPFEGETPLSVAMMHVNNQVVPPTKHNESIPPALEQIVLKAMEKDPAHRFRSAASMGRALKLYSKNNAIVFAPGTLDSMDETSLEPQSSPKKEEKEKKTKRIRAKHGRRTMFPVIFGVTCAFMAVFLVAGILAGITLLDMTKDSSITVIVPDLKGLQYSLEYAKTLEEDNMKIVSIEYVYDKDSPSGMIVDQSPKAGERKKLKDNTHFCEIELKISQGNETVVIPDLAITEYRGAIIALQNLNLQATPVQISNSAVMNGYVINTDPPAGSIVQKDTLVTVYVSTGQDVPQTAMPDLIGKSLAEAKSILAQSNIILGKVTREPSTEVTGTILSQSIEPGRLVPVKYTIVDLVLSIQIPTEPLPIPTPPVSSTVPVTTVPATSAPIPPTSAPISSATKPRPTLPVITLIPPPTSPASTVTPSSGSASSAAAGTTSASASSSVNHSANNPPATGTTPTVPPVASSTPTVPPAGSSSQIVLPPASTTYREINVNE